MAKGTRTNNDLQNTTPNIKDRARRTTRTTLKLRCSGRVSRLSFRRLFTTFDYPIVLCVLLLFTAFDYPIVLSVLLLFTAFDYLIVLSVLPLFTAVVFSVLLFTAFEMG
jgi:hypothetical protein